MSNKKKAMEAAINGNSAMLELALQGPRSKACANQLTNFNRAILTIAAGKPGEFGRECVKALILAGADISHRDDSGATALMWAARCGAFLNVRELLAAGADPLLTSTDGLTALHASGMSRCAKSAQALLAAGCPLEARARDGKTFLDIYEQAINSPRQVNEEFVQLVESLRARQELMDSKCIFEAGAESAGKAPRL